MSNEDSLPSWWTDKITLAKDYVSKSRDYIMNPAEGVDEGFGGELKGRAKQKFEKARKANGEQLGYKLTGTSDIKESVNEGISDKMSKIMSKLAKSLNIKSVVDMHTGKGSLSYFLDDEREALKLQKFLQKSFKRVRKINLDKEEGDTANFVVAADMLGLESINESEQDKIKQFLMKKGDNEKDATEKLKYYDMVSKMYKGANSTKKAEIMSSLWANEAVNNPSFFDSFSITEVRKMSDRELKDYLLYMKKYKPDVWNHMKKNSFT